MVPLVIAYQASTGIGGTQDLVSIDKAATEARGKFEQDEANKKIAIDAKKAEILAEKEISSAQRVRMLTATEETGIHIYIDMISFN